MQGFAAGLMALLCLALALLSTPAIARSKAAIRIGFTTHGWSSQGQDPATWHAAIRPLLDALSSGLALTYSLYPVKNAAGLARKMKAGEINLGLSWALDYVQVAQQVAVKPVAAMQWQGKLTTQVLLLVRRDSGINAIGGLRGKRLSVVGKDPLTQRYFARLLRRAQIEDPQRFFGSVVRKEKPKSAVLATYFKQVEGCLVWASVLEAMVRLNPQLKRALKPIVVSPPFANPLIYARADMPGDRYKALRARALVLHQRAEGKQLLLTGRVERMRAVNDALFETTRALLHDQAQDRARARPATPRRPRR